MARYYESRAKAPNHRPDKFNDEHRSNKDMSQSFDFHAGGNEDDLANREFASMRTERMQEDGMIREDRRAIANLPQEVMMKPYPMTGPYMPEGLDDSIRGVDGQMDYDDKQRASHFYPKKV